MRVARLAQRLRRFRQRLEPVREVEIEFFAKGGMGELRREDRRDAERQRGRDLLMLQLLQHGNQRQVAVERGFADPVRAVGPAPMMKHPGQVTVQREHEAHRHAVRLAASAIARV